MTRLLTFACWTLLLLPCAGEAGTLRRQSPAQSDEVVPGVVIVKFKAGVNPSPGILAKAGTGLSSTLARRGVKTLDRIFPAVKPLDAVASAAGRVDLSRIFYATVDAASDVRVIAYRLSTLQQVEYAEPKYRQHISEVPNDPLYNANQVSYFSRLNAVAGWSVAKGDPSVTIADVDGGTYWQHEDLNRNLWINSAEDINHNGRFDMSAAPAGDDDGIDQDGDGFVDDVIGWNFTNNTNNPRGLSATPLVRAHGTATASHFGAVTNNDTGMAGSSWNCRLMPICAASATTDNSIDFGYEGIQFAASHGAHVINCSWGRLGVFSEFEHDVVVAATQAGALIVAAAGNDSVDVDVKTEYPASFPEVFGIGATNSTNDGITYFTNYGVNVTVYAPGTNIWSALDGGGYANGGSGTSYSSPLVAGLAGIVKSVHPTWTPEQIKAQIRTTADSLDAVNTSFAGKVGRGRANFGRALTESHAGIQVLTASILTPSGRDFFIPGDTAVVSLTVKNVLPRTAGNLQVTASASDPSLIPLATTASVASLAQDAQAVLSPLTFVVGQLSTNRVASIEVHWVSNGNEWDGRAYRVFMFTQIPHWLLQSTPAAASLFSVRAVSTTTAWASGGDGNATAATVVRTVDSGQHWTNVTGLLSGADFYTVFAVDAVHAWVGSGDGRIFATSDAGLSWSQQLYPGTQSPFIDGIWFFDVNNGFALGDPATGISKYILLKTTDGGNSWAHLANEPPAGTGEAGWNNSFWWTDAQHGWFGTNQSKIRGTSDGGASWFVGTTGSQNSLGVSFRDDLNGVAVFDDGYAQVTINGGATWILRNKPAQAATLVSVAAAPGTDAIWTSDGLLPYRSHDGGRTWTTESTFPFSGSILHLSFADSTNGWASTSFGEALRYHLDSPTSVITPPGGTPVTFQLNQNYPNPFNSSTLIRYSVPVQSHVTVTIYDVLGRKVQVVYEGDRAAGSYDIRFSGEQLASGVYFYRFKTDQFESTRKMLLMR